MGKFWALLFGVTMLACLVCSWPLLSCDGWWLQEGRSTHYWHIDFLYYVILAITGFFFILTEAILVYFMFRYAGQPDGKPPQPKPSVFAGMLKPLADVLNEPHKIELAWTIIPAAILLYIAFAQVGTWAAVKYQSRYPEIRQGQRQECSRRRRDQRPPVRVAHPLSQLQTQCRRLGGRSCGFSFGQGVGR